jgi:hypothetical protein
VRESNAGAFRPERCGIHEPRPAGRSYAAVELAQASGQRRRRLYAMEEVVSLHSLRHERHDQRRDGDARGDLHEQVLPELKYENHGTEDSGEWKSTRWNVDAFPTIFIDSGKIPTHSNDNDSG